MIWAIPIMECFTNDYQIVNIQLRGKLRTKYINILHKNRFKYRFNDFNLFWL
jgi:hypothetical protein